VREKKRVNGRKGESTSHTGPVSRGIYIYPSSTPRNQTQRTEPLKRTFRLSQFEWCQWRSSSAWWFFFFGLLGIGLFRSIWGCEWR
jgi:hypothetical protein